MSNENSVISVYYLIENIENAGKGFTWANEVGARQETGR